MIRSLGLLGHPLGHSVSPAFQQAALDHLGLDVRYEVWDVEPARLAAFVLRLRGPDYLGANVTIPHKEAVLGMVDEVDDFARRIGAMNTVVNRDGRLLGYNTDAPGFLRALREDGGFDVRRKRVVVLGAGGAAKGVCFALAGAGASAITIANRTLERGLALAGQLRGLGMEVEAVTLSDVAGPLARSDLLVNCTSVGMWHGVAEAASPVPEGLIPPGIMAFDLVYNPAVTPFLQAAQTRGARTLGGLTMLVYQGAESFRLWTGREAPVDIMMTAARKALIGIAAKGVKR